MREIFDDHLENSAKALRGFEFLIEVGNGDRLLTVTSARGVILISGHNLECNFGSSNKGYVGVCILY